jgi:DNA end-binding protein Ku
MAQQLIDSLTSDWDPSKYRDDYRERVLELIERKAAGEEIAVQPTEEPAPVPDLMAALEQSLAAVRSEQATPAGGAKKAKTGSSNGRGGGTKKRQKAGAKG